MFEITRLNYAKNYNIDRYVIHNIVKKILDDKKFPLVLGGEHSITAGVIRAFAEKKKDFSVIQFDAHLDLRHTYQRTLYSHACVMQRIYEMGVDFVQIGIRSGCKEEYEFAKKEGIAFFPPELIRDNPEALSDAVADLKNNVYITFDVDAFDSSLMPSTGTPEPGGLFWDEAIDIIRMIAESKKIIGCDVVELSPSSASVAPDFAAAKLAYKLLGYALCT